MTWIFRFLLFLVLLGVIRAVLSALLGGGRQKNLKDKKRATGSGAPPETGKMVKDPQCGMYIATTLAIPLKKQGETAYFCSEECRSKYLHARSEA